jgi:O-antigen/teichoic acid export membrane protein
MFFLLPIYTRYLGVYEYGIIESMTVFSSILTIIFSLGIHNSVYRLYYDYESENAKKQLFGTIGFFVFLFSIIISLFLFIGKDFTGLIFKNIPFDPFFKFAILTTLLTNLAELPKAYLIINEKALQYTIISIVQFLLNTGIALYFLIILKSDASGLLKGQLLSSLVMSPFFIVFSLKHFKYKPDLKMLKSSLVFSIPALPTLLSAWILNLSDRIFIEHYINPKALGVYSLGYKIASIIGFAFTAIDMSYMPLFFKLANSKNESDLLKIKLLNRIYLSILLLLVFIVSLFSKEFIIILFSKDFFDSYKIIIIVSFVFFLSQFCALISKNLSQSKKIKQGMYIDLSAAVLNICFNLLLIPHFGIYGAAWATLLSFLYSVIVYYFYSLKHTFFIDFNLNEMFIFLVTFLIILIIIYSLNLSISISMILKIVLTIIILIFYYLYFRFSFRKLI